MIKQVEMCVDPTGKPACVNIEFQQMLSANVLNWLSTLPFCVKPKTHMKGVLSSLTYTTEIIILYFHTMETYTEQIMLALSLRNLWEVCKCRQGNELKYMISQY